MAENFKAMREIMSRVYEVENTPEILNFTVPNVGVALWLGVRSSVLSACYNSLVPITEHRHDPWPKSTFSISETSFTRTIEKWPQKEIWIHSFLYSAYYKDFKNRKYDHIYEPLAEVYPENTLFLDSCPRAPFISPEDGIAIQRMMPFNQWLAKLSNEISIKVHIDVVTKFIRFLKERLDKVKIKLSPMYYEQIGHNTLLFCRISSIRTKIYNIILQKYSPKICIAHALLDGNCPDLVYLLKKNNVVVVEPQHSLLGYSVTYAHFAENIIKEKFLKDMLPDIFLTYGKYWNDKHNTPACSYVVGNPWFTVNTELYPYSGEDAILFALNAEYDNFLPYIVAIKKIFPRKKIIVRPHPGHRETIYKESKLSTLGGVEHDVSSNIYETLAMCDTVVCEYSGAIYDAISTGKRVFVKKTLITHELERIGFSFFKTVDDLITLIHEKESPSEDIKNLYFDRNWKENYSRFIQKYVKL